MLSRTFMHRLCRITMMSLGTWLIPTCGLIVGGCENTLFFAERTSFSLAVHVNDNPSTPLEVSAGLKRDVGAVVPPNDVKASGQNNQKVPVGEATSLLSGFRLHDDTKNTVLPFDDVVTIRTQFASGYAARDVVDNHPEAVSTIVNVRLAGPVPDDLQKRREAAVQVIEALNDQEVNQLARALGIAEDAHAKSNLRLAVSQAETVDAFENIAQKIKLLFGKEV